MDEETDEEDSEDEDNEDTPKHRAGGSDEKDPTQVIRKAKVEDDEYKTDEQTYYRYLLIFFMLQVMYCLCFWIFHK